MADAARPSGTFEDDVTVTEDAVTAPSFRVSSLSELSYTQSEDRSKAAKLPTQAFQRRNFHTTVHYVTMSPTHTVKVLPSLRTANLPPEV